MSFWTTLAKIAGVAAPVALAPFTAGTSLAALPAILGGVGDAASVLGKQQEGAAAGRAKQGEATQAQDRNAISLYGQEQSAQNAAAQTDLDRKKFTTSDRGTNAKQALMAQLLQGGVPRSNVGVSGITPATMGPSLSDNLLKNPDALATLKTLGTQASGALNNPAPFTGGATVAPPTLTALPTESKSSSFLDTLARIGQIAGTAGKAFGGPSDTVRMDGTPDVPASTLSMDPSFLQYLKTMQGGANG